MEKIINWFKLHIDFKFNIFAIISLLLVVLIPFLMNFLPKSWGYENGVLENIQMVVLFCACFIALKTKAIDNKKFFIFVFLIITIIILREINCGRTLFFPIPGKVNAFYSWKQIPYGYLAHPIYGIYMGLVGIYFIINKLWINLFNYLKNYKFPIFNFLFTMLGMFLGLYAEKSLHNDIFEELGELLFYISLFSVIYLYSYNKQNKIYP